MNTIVNFLLLCSLAMALPSAIAQTDKVEQITGQVVKVDVERGKVTLAHARIKSINMAAMTMPFKVRDAVMLADIKLGDRVMFSVAVIQDELVITQLDLTQPSKVRP